MGSYQSKGRHWGTSNVLKLEQEDLGDKLSGPEITNCDQSVHKIID